MRDLDGDGYAESIRGSSRSIGQNDTLYMELNVLTNGHLEDGLITINNNNFYFQTTIPKDNEIKENAIGSNIKQIKLNTINNGTQKLLTGIIRSGEYNSRSTRAQAIGNDTSKYSKENSIVLTGTHVAEDGTRTEIRKEVKFKVDWHGKIATTIVYTNLTSDIEKAINEEANELNLNFTVTTKETEEELILKKSVVEGILPEVNGYSPIKVELKSSNAKIEYNEETREFKITREAAVNSQTGIVESGLSRQNGYSVCVTYPLEAYTSMGLESLQIKVPVTSYHEGYNNPNKEMEVLFREES